jgi:hypothetical protein
MTTWDSSCGGEIWDAARDETTLAVTTVSTKLFHSWQSGQRPSHFRLSLPHCWQAKTVLGEDLSVLLTA